MARIVKEHNERKKELLQAALMLFAEKGYDKTSVNDILKIVGVAKGTFYHYFRSIDELLDSLIDGLTEQIMAEIETVVDDPSVSAIDKLNRVMSISRRIKAENVDIIKAIISVNYKKENVVVKHKLRARNSKVLLPLYTRIIRQGIDEGTFNIPYVEEAARLLVGMTNTMSDENTRLSMTLKEKPDNLDRIGNNLKLLELATERLLGIPAGSFQLHDENFLKEFMDKLQS